MVALFALLGYLRRGVLPKSILIGMAGLTAIYISTLLGSPIEVKNVKTFVFAVKILLCVCLYSTVKDKIIKFDFQKFLDYAAFLFFWQTLFALAYKTDLLWRLFGFGRLELFYLEPSELGVFVGFLVILQFYYLINTNRTKRKFLNFIILATVLGFSQSLSGILYTVFAIGILIVFRDGGSLTGKKILAFCILIIALLMLVSTENFISERLVNIWYGEDSSFDTRFNFPMEMVSTYYREYGMAGFGLGNMNTAEGLSFFHLKASNYVICAAYFLFALEGGIIALLLEVLFTMHIFYQSLRKKESLYLALFIVMFFYMYLGGYTTNPMIWIICGFIAAPVRMEQFTDDR